MATAKSWTIGAAPECDLVVDQPTVSGRHCRLVRTDEGYLLEDLGSTNGTFVNGVPLQGTCPVTPNDRITLGRTLPMPWPDERGRRFDLQKHKRTAAAIGGGLACLLLIILLLRPGGDRTQPSDAGGVPEQQVGVVGGEAQRSLPNAAEPPAGSPTPQPPGGEAKRRDPGHSDDPGHALFSVLVGDRTGRESYRVGTAWAASERQLVTSAAAVKVLEQLQEFFPRAALKGPGLESELEIVATRVHPEYQKAYEQAETARQESDRLRERLQQADDPDSGVELTDAEIEAALKELVDAEERRFQATERQCDYDVAVLEVRERLPISLPLAGRDAKIIVQSSVRAFGLPFENEDPLVSPGIALRPAFLTGRVRPALPHHDAGTVSERLLVGCEREHLVHNWMGCAVLDAEGRAVAVYSRPTPAVDPSEPPAGDSYDAAPLGLLQDFAPELFRED